MPALLQEAVSVIRKYAPHFYPKVGIVLGSGLGALAEQLTQPITIPYQAIPGLHAGAVQGHASLLVMGQLNGVPVVCLKGRLHKYEGTSNESLCLLIRLVKQLGAHDLILTGAAGSLRPEIGAGEIAIITDHINMHPGNPLIGPNDESIGPRFLGLENAYDSELQDIQKKAAARLKIKLHSGVYLSVIGPAFETPAEVRAFKILGADFVGMSVVPETIIARHCGLRVAGFAAVVNLAVGLTKEKVTHEGTLQFAEVAGHKLVKLIPEMVKDMASAY